MPNQEWNEIFEEGREFLLTLQDEICKELQTVEASSTSFDNLASKQFQEENWTASGWIKEGGGRSRLIEEGRVIERGGVNFSDVGGEFSEDFAKSMPGDTREFRACGVSLVIHPRNPFAPTVHANFRMIRRGDEKFWFGGGADLTPMYFQEEDAKFFHRKWKEVCDKHMTLVDYVALKEQCDRYFHIPHRGESRGIGGIFYDYKEENHRGWLAFMKDAGRTFVSSYIPILQDRMTQQYSEAHREFQLYRRGRYVEFNLIYDRGTHFGLKTGGRVESILMSLPPVVRYSSPKEYEDGSPEALTMSVLRQPRSFV